MISIGGRGLIIALALLLAVVGCARSQAKPPAPTAVAEKPSGLELLEKAIKELEQSPRYRFSIVETHFWPFEGRIEEWEFRGEGEAKGEIFTSRLEGPADSLFIVKIDGSSVEAWDARGNVPNATRAFGGPGTGAAPFTLIAYLKNPAEAGDPVESELDGRPAYTVPFVPALDKVAALDPGHAKAMTNIRSAKGEAWFNKQTGWLMRERIELEIIDQAGQNERVVATVDLVEITIERTSRSRQ